MTKITIKTKEELKIMADGGKKLGEITGRLREIIKEGVKASEIEDLALELIKNKGGEASFTKVPNYHWATCVNVNSGLVHGIPRKEIVFKKGDVISVDIGFCYRGFQTDASFTCAISPTTQIKKFLEVGEKALACAIKVAQAGNKISDISKQIEKTIKEGGYVSIQALVGHGIGRNLHEEPAIPCFFSPKHKDVEIKEGMALALEIMYTMGSPEVFLNQDGWTISTCDGKISGLFEETVAVTADGPLVLTESKYE